VQAFILFTVGSGINPAKKSAGKKSADSGERRNKKTMLGLPSGKTK
jgi:hypothetical protein